MVKDSCDAEKFLFYNEKMLLRTLFLSLVAVSCQAATPLDGLAPGRYEQKLTSSGVERELVLHVPKQAESGERPLIIALHGWTASGPIFEAMTELGKLGTERGYIVAFPNGLGQRRGWNAGFIDLSGQGKDDVQFISDIIESVAKQTKVDRSKIFLTGHSNGAFMSHYAAAKLGPKIAAIGAVAGTVGVGEKKIPDLPTGTKTHVLMIHCTDDNMVAYATESKSLLKGIPQEVGASWWAKQLGLGGEPTIEGAETDARRTRSWTSTNGARVQLVTLGAGGHAWPGGRTLQGRESVSGFNATEAILNFFDQVK